MAKKKKPRRAARSAAGGSAAGGPAGSTLSFEWRRWAADNLLRGVSAAKVRGALESQGVPQAEARSRVDEILGSPIFAAGAEHARRARQLQQITDLLDDHRKAVPTQTVREEESWHDELFLSRYYATNTPACYRGVADDWPAVARWTPEDFKERFSEVEIGVTTGREADPDYDIRHETHIETMTMGAYVDRIRGAGDESNDVYMIARNRNIDRAELAPLLAEVRVPDVLDPTRFKGCTALWLGPAGTLTSMHHDTSNILFFQIYGRKRVVLAPPTHLPLLDGARSMYSPVQNPEADADHPALVGAVLPTVDLDPGDALFLPAGWWHYVRSLDVSISIAFNGFRADNAFEWYTPANA